VFGDEDSLVFGHVRQHASETLIKRLKARIAHLQSADVDAIMLEIRCQTAEAGVTGHLSVASDLHDLALDVLQAMEHGRKL
jgi:hypothetical protein